VTRSSQNATCRSARDLAADGTVELIALDVDLSAGWS